MPVVGNAEASPPPEVIAHEPTGDSRFDGVLAKFADDLGIKVEPPAEAPTAPAEAQASEPAQATEATPEATRAPAEAPPAKTTAEERREFIKNQKARRMALQAKKEAEAAQARLQADLARVQQFQAAAQNWQKDPTQVFQAAGIDPVKFYEAAAQKTLGEPEADPMAQKIAEINRPYVEQLQQAKAEAEAEKQKLQQQHEAVAEHNVVASRVFPVVADPEKFEALHQFYGGAQGAAAAVYKAVKQHWADTLDPQTGQGEVIQFEDAAAQLEAHFSKQIEEGLQRALGMKKFAQKYAKPAEAPKPAVAEQIVAAQAAAKPPAKTLSNSQSPAVSRPVMAGSAMQGSYSIGDARIDEILARHGIE